VTKQYFPSTRFRDKIRPYGVENKEGPPTRCRRSRALEEGAVTSVDSTIDAIPPQVQRRLQSDDGSNIADCPISRERRKSGQRVASRCDHNTPRPGPSGKPTLVVGQTNFAHGIRPSLPRGRGCIYRGQGEEDASQCGTT